MPINYQSWGNICVWSNGVHCTSKNKDTLFITKWRWGVPTKPYYLSSWEWERILYYKYVIILGLLTAFDKATQQIVL